ncbi:MAG: hypothetical protein JXR52_10055 [Bacteroidales bacterium]|nr:hypothetical protein [Bacteroidales bacterium]
MPLQEETYLETINSYTLKDWQPLFDLIPEIEATVKFGADYQESPRNEDGSINLPHVFGSEIIYKFQEIFYDISIMVGFDWGSWEEGKEMINNKDFDYGTLDIPTKCKIITTIVRANRFSEGFLVRCFENGLVLNVLK